MRTSPSLVLVDPRGLRRARIRRRLASIAVGVAIAAAAAVHYAASMQH